MSSRKAIIFHIIVGTEYSSDDMWNGGDVASDDSVNVVYSGKPLSPCTEYYLKISVKNNYDEQAEYESRFETAFLCDDFSAWDGAEFIGAPEYYVCSEASGVFSLESEIIMDGNGRAGIIFGADDYRLENRELNEMFVEGENYISVCIDRKKLSTTVEVFRVGYSSEDKIDVPFAFFELPKEAENVSYKLKLDVTGNCVNINVNGVSVGHVQINPLGDNDVTTFPRLGNIGYYADKHTKVHSER